MREAVISAATLVGLVGLVAILNSNGSSRTKRATDLSSLDDEVTILANTTNTDNDDITVDEFLQSMGMDTSAIDNFFNDDVNYKQDPENPLDPLRSSKKKGNKNAGKGAKGNSKLKLNDCVLLAECNAKMQSVQETKAVQCKNFLINNNNIHPLVSLECMQEMCKEDGSCAFEDSCAAIADKSADSNGNNAIASAANPEAAVTIARKDMYQRGGIFFGMIVPEGIPVTSEVGQHKNNYLGYSQAWAYYINEYVMPHISKSASVQVWVAKEGKKLSGVFAKPIRVKKNFPLDKIVKVFANPAQTNSMPYMLKSVQTLIEFVDNYGLQSTPSEEKDCFFVWFHQNLPYDIAQFMLPENMDRIFVLNSYCTVTHVWMGFNTPVQKEAVGLLQSLYQPEVQASGNIAKVPEMRNWHVISWETLTSNSIMDTLYQHQAVERARFACLITTPLYVWPRAAEAEDDDSIFATENLEEPAAIAEVIDAVDGIVVAESEEKAAEADYYDDDSSEDLSFFDDAIAEVGLPAVNLCCGSGTTGTVYDTNTKSCCEDFSVKAFDSTGEDGCFTLK